MLPPDIVTNIMRDERVRFGDVMRGCVAPSSEPGQIFQRYWLNVLDKPVSSAERLHAYEYILAVTQDGVESVNIPVSIFASEIECGYAMQDQLLRIVAPFAKKIEFVGNCSKCIRYAHVPHIGGEDMGFRP